MANYVQFKGMDHVISAFKYRAVEAWSLWQGKQFIHKGIGTDELHTFLSMLQQGGSNAIYTLKVYEEITDASDIKDNTSCDGSFNFNLWSPEMLPATGYNNQIVSRLTAIEERLTEEEDKPKKNKLGIIGDILDHPMMEQIAPIVIPQILDWIMGKKAQPYKPQPQAAIAGINNEEDLQKAIQILLQHDNQLTKHLLKLSEIAINNPQSFKFLIQTLDSM
jgi:hypothetical protein